MKRDILTEMMTGVDGSISVDGKAVFRDMGVNTASDGRKYRVTIMACLVITAEDNPICEHPHQTEVSHKGDVCYQEEMWVGKITMEPTDKFHTSKLRGESINGIYTSGGFDPHGYIRHFPVDQAVRERMEEALRVPDEDD